MTAWALLASARFKSTEPYIQAAENALSANPTGDTDLLRDLQGPS
jgi:hypothetical protein